MNRSYLSILVFITLLLTGSLFSQEDHRDHKFPPETYERPGRDEHQKPDEVLKALQLKPENTIADIGAGSGYFMRRFAAAVPAGTVYAVDIDEVMLRHIHRESEKLQLHNVVTVLSAPDNPMLPANSIDLVFICNTLHHINERTSYYKRIASVLKNGGRLAIVDYYKKALPVGPPPDEKLSKEEVLKEITGAGFVLQQDLTFLPYQYFLIFSAPER